MTKLTEFLPGVFHESRSIILDFAHIPQDTPDCMNIQKYFENCFAHNINPRAPENRQAFNNRAIEFSGSRYLVGSYAENRSAMLGDTQIAREGRTYHMGIDIFCADQPDITAPCDGEIIKVGFEEGFGGYGNYLLFQTADNNLLLFGHLANDPHVVGTVRQGSVIARVGDFANGENGGWSRHLHLQCFTQIPPNNKTPDGYASASKLDEYRLEFPDPSLIFPDWIIK